MLLAILLVVTPVALLARPATYGKAKCTGMCCRPPARHTVDPVSAAPSLAANSVSERKEMTCERGVAAHLAMCLIPSNAGNDYGAVAPLPPVILTTVVPIAGPQWFREALPLLSGFSLSGILPAPFKPPRS